MFDSLPIFGVCGYSGSGKTTLLTKIIPGLVRSGLRVAVVKHDVHGIRDKEDKDSGRLFRTGADVVVRGPEDSFGQCKDDRLFPLEYELERLAQQYDLVLLEGFKQLPCRKVWLRNCEDSSPPDGIGPWEAVLPWDAERVAIFRAVLSRFLSDATNRMPVFGCVLIGGQSARMGSPKHLLPCADDMKATWLHRTVRTVQQNCARVVLAGSGAVPQDLQEIPRLVDAPGAEGPMAGLLAALRWAPRASWLLAACDLPALRGEALQWILAQRTPGVWTVLPCIERSANVEPLLAWYDFRCRHVLESTLLSCQGGLRKLAQHPKTRVVTVPAVLAGSWQDADTPEAIELFSGISPIKIDSPMRQVRTVEPIHEY